MNAAERRLYWWGHWRLGVPAATTLLLVLVMTAPLVVPVPVFPQVALLGIFIWATFQPGLMPPWVAFLVGLIADLLFAQPLGLNAALFAAAAAFVRVFEARYGHHTHGFDWGVAAAAIIAFELATWQLMTLAGRPIPLPPLGWQIVTSIVAYPVVVAFCALIQRRAFGADDRR
ncbi:MAG: rod shape-determining protein MreD [Polymorphobacter sp.]